MGWVDEFADWATSDVTVEPYTGPGAWEDGYGAPVTVLAFVEFVNRTVTSSDGTQVVSEATFYCGPEYRGSITDKARVRLPGDSRVYRVVRIRTWMTGDDHIEVNLA